MRRNKIRSFSLVLMLGLASASAHALENSGAIKVKQLIKTTQSWNGDPITYPVGQAEITGMMVEFAPGAETGWHKHPAPSFGVILEGELFVTLKDGKTKLLKAGDAAVEVTNTWHNGKNTGTVPTKLIVFYAGAVGQQLTVRDTQKDEK